MFILICLCTQSLLEWSVWRNEYTFEQKILREFLSDKENH